MSVGQSMSYNFAVDVNDAPHPPDQVIQMDGPARAAKVFVKCELRAKLVPVGDGIAVTPDPTADDRGWVYRDFSPDGIAPWSWTVTAKDPAPQQLRVELTPAVSSAALRYGTPTNIEPYTTTVNVTGTWLDHTKYWFEVQFPAAKYIASAIGAALLAVLVFIPKAREALRKAFGRAEPKDPDGHQSIAERHKQDPDQDSQPSAGGRVAP
ncbi:hypothetical protein [Sinomonas notoginsengisoli]|uniref:hypothetical protein n=1 Tax=Sinomonas notoginsengisoli TaxID=1457311 RepID=UPI001F385F83|nr:hypothetical protein [Sinomonas notoginsengisoli]